MTQQILPVAKRVAAVAVIAVALYTVLQVVQAQQPGPSAVGDFVAPVDVDTTGLRGPVQPIFYRHDIHAGQYQMNCLYCHYAAEVSSSPGLPSVDTCMGCHLLVGGSNPEVAKVREAFASGKPIEWVEVHRLPPFVHFPHMRHVNADIRCQECHGQVEEMPQVYQWASLKMGWCLSCHKQNNVTTDCTACHY